MLLKLIVIDAMKLALLTRYYSTRCRFNVCTEHPGCQSHSQWAMAAIYLMNWQLAAVA